MPFFAHRAQREGGIATAYIGLLLGCYAGGELLATSFLGGIADRVGRRPTLLVSALGVGLLYLTRGVRAGAAAGTTRRKKKASSRSGPPCATAA